MRLAADYQQKHTQVQDIPKRPITRLGKGAPQQIRRKRGISRSEDNPDIQNRSLDKRQISKEKYQQIEQMYSSKQSYGVKHQPSSPKIISAACYGNRFQRKDANYVAQHLLVTPPVGSPRMDYDQPFRGLVHVKSQDSFFHPRPKSIFQNYSKVSAEDMSKEVYMPLRVSNQGEKRVNFIGKSQNSNINWKVLRSPQKVDFVQAKLPVNKVQKQIKRQIQGSKCSIEFNYNRGSQAFDTAYGKQQIVNSPYIATQKMIKSKQDPTRMSGTKMTRRFQGISPQRQREQELKATKKQVRRTNQYFESQKQMQSSSLLQSKNRQSKKVTSLWDANKTQSIVSVRESEEIKMQESQIMVDYFNPASRQNK